MANVIYNNFERYTYYDQLIFVPVSSDHKDNNTYYCWIKHKTRLTRLHVQTSEVNANRERWPTKVLYQVWSKLTCCSKWTQRTIIVKSQVGSD